MKPKNEFVYESPIQAVEEFSRELTPSDSSFGIQEMWGADAKGKKNSRKNKKK
ncbi:hypothetical protein [Alteribacter aurantiacus]|uniref:hypothetical protein n=1 Tax=Alteribacter aurantiacus TaxID=254410 RepID=UPI0004028EBF|nr:hypothetical protein [Alteribacter aurantiacus]